MNIANTLIGLVACLVFLNTSRVRGPRRSDPLVAAFRFRPLQAAAAAAVLTLTCGARGLELVGSVHAGETLVTVHADPVLFRLEPTVIGANMEDLHYQMVGGFDSQMLHGESFFEHSPTELAPRKAPLDGFVTVSGLWTVTNGVAEVVVRPGDGTAFLERGLGGGRPPEAPDPAPAKDPGARLTSLDPVAPGTSETRASFRFTADDDRPAGLIAHVHPNFSDNGWNWYSGYTVELDPKAQVIRLLSASRANQPQELASAPVPIPRDAWVPVALCVRDNRLIVWVAGRDVLACQPERLLPVGHVGVIARGQVWIRDLAVVSAEDSVQPLPLRPNPLLAAPGDALSLRWARLQSGSARGAFAFDPEGWHPGLRSQQILFEGGEGEFGCDNAGLERSGLALHAGRNYAGFLRVKTAAPADVIVSLRGADGKTILAEQTLRTRAGQDYQRLEFALTPVSSDSKGRFAITLREPGRVTVGYAFLQPGEWGRYKGLPVRRDLAEALIAQGIKLLRLNGGMIEVPGYRWKNLHGPRDQRRPYDGFYDRYCSSGYGPVEHLAFCQAAGFVPVVGLNIEETPEDVADFIAYCNAPRGTPAGDRRAADGYPEPFGLRYYQVGNESGVNAKYVERFKPVAEAIWKVDPAVTVIPCGLTYDFKAGAQADDVRKRLAAHLDLSRFVRSRGKPLLWDVHVFNKNDDPAQSYGWHLPGGIEFSRWLTRLEPSLGPVPVLVGEFNAARFNFNRGLAHAVELAQAHRAGDVVWGTAMPNVSQPCDVYQSDWKAVLWTQGNIDYTPDRVWFQPAYYVQQMIARAWAPEVVAVETAAARGTLDVFAAKSTDGSRLVLRVVNLTGAPQTARFDLQGIAVDKSPARLTTLAHDDLMDFNTRSEPERIRPVTSEWRHAGRPDTWTFPRYSFTVIELSILPAWAVPGKAGSSNQTNTHE